MEEKRTTAEPKPAAAFVLALIAGLWMLASRGMMASFGWHMTLRHTWLWRYRPFRGAPLGGLWSWLGFIAGLIVLASAVVIYARPAETRTWGKVILIASVANLILPWGGFVPGLLGIIAGALAIGWGRQKG